MDLNFWNYSLDPNPMVLVKENQELDNTNRDPRPYFNEGLVTPVFK